MESVRLIDADALLANQPEGCYRTSDWINAAPTIDAIPVEWLRKWPKDLREGAYVRDIMREWQKEQEAR